MSDEPDHVPGGAHDTIVTRKSGEQVFTAREAAQEAGQRIRGEKDEIDELKAQILAFIDSNPMPVEHSSRAKSKLSEMIHWVRTGIEKRRD